MRHQTHPRVVRFIVRSVACFIILVGLSHSTVQAVGIAVNTTADDNTVNGNCTLREALIAADDNVTKDACGLGGTVDTISFNINASTDPGCNAGTGVCTIQLATELPVLDGSGSITIDGYTQPGAAPASGSTPAEIRIEIDGSAIVSGNPFGLEIQSPGNLIKGVAIGNFFSGIVLAGSSASGNSIEGCHIGTDASGTADWGNASLGISLFGAGTGNQIGGSLSAQRNVISGNDSHGIDLVNTVTGTTISGNYIGTTADGLSALPNQNGINIRQFSYANTIGGSSPGERNVISGNAVDGISLNGGTGNPHDNLIEGNYIGVDRTGATALPNGQNGVQIVNGGFANIVGPGNIISGNGQHGVNIWTTGTIENMVRGNYIGTDSTGTAAIPNTLNGVFLNSGATANEIGGDLPGEGNLISGNDFYGVRISGTGTNSNIVSGNIIGLDINGTAALLNFREGIAVANSADNTKIGGTTLNERNIIVASYAGVLLEVGASNTTVSGNYIGTDITGTVGFGVGTGVVISSASHDNTVGGLTAAERNIISGNGGRGFNIYGAGTDHNQVMGNYIGVDVTGVNPLGNPSDGIRIWNSAQDNTIGPNNIIAYNGDQGIYIYGADTDRNIITQNSIYAHSQYNISMLTDGSNEDLAAPEITSVNLNPLSVTGTTSPACVGCTVEVFTSQVSYPRAGRTYLGSATTNGSGDWTVMTPGLHGPYITATVTDASKGTSMYSPSVFTPITSLYLPLIMR